MHINSCNFDIIIKPQTAISIRNEGQNVISVSTELILPVSNIQQEEKSLQDTHDNTNTDGENSESENSFERKSSVEFNADIYVTGTTIHIPL